MNDATERRNNADLPRPRQMTDTFHDIYQEENLPPLRRSSEETASPVHTQEFKIPKQHKKNSDAFNTQELNIYEPVQEYAEDPEEDSGYGAYEEYDHVSKPSSAQKHKKNTRSASTGHKKQTHSPRKQSSGNHHSHKPFLLSFLLGFLRILLRPVLALFLTLFITYSVTALSLIHKLEKVPRGERSVTSGSLDRSYVRSVLLIGTDARDVSTERGRSDTMLLLSLNSRTQQIYLTSFMRDAYVDIPGHGYNRLNAAYSFGGSELLMDTLEQNYQISIDDCFVVSFMGFAGIIDAFGGVDVTLSDDEAKALNTILQSEVNQLAGDDPMADFIEKGGKYLLNGKQALSYARIRYVGNADFERTSRQREVMEQLLQNAKTKAVTSVPKLFSSAMPHLGTNMTDWDMYLLSLRVPLAARYDIAQIQIPADGTYTPADIDGQSVLQIDFDANIQKLKETVYSSPEASANQ